MKKKFNPAQLRDEYLNKRQFEKELAEEEQKHLVKQTKLDKISDLFGTGSFLNDEIKFAKSVTKKESENKPVEKPAEPEYRIIDDEPEEPKYDIIYDEAEEGFSLEEIDMIESRLQFDIENLRRDINELNRIKEKYRNLGKGRSQKPILPGDEFKIIDNDDDKKDKKGKKQKDDEMSK